LDLQAFDASYVDRLRGGDAETERHFFSYFGELIRIKVRSRLRSHQFAEDVRQETLLRVLRALRSPDGIRSPERLGAFVNAVCNNVLLELFRAQRRHPLPADATSRLAEETGSSPEDRFLERERQIHVRRIIDGLSTRDRRVLRALFIEERDKDEVCAALGVGRDYLRVLLHRAKAEFRRRYLEQQPVRAGRNAGRAARSVGS
jgi:RNA polymerase sigma-70 factor (ECF subfamily)